MNRAANPDLKVTLEPLTRRNRDGDVYVRESDVELQIVGALVLSEDALRQSAAISDSASPTYLKEECLVYLIRHWRLRGDEPRVSDLCSALVRRTTPIVRKHLASLGPDCLEEGHSRVVTRLFGQVLDLSNDKADFFQVRFWVRMERMCIQVFGEMLAEVKRSERQLPFSDVPGYGQEPENGEVQSPTVIRLTDGDRRRLSTPSPEEAFAGAELSREARRLALTLLEEPFRSAYILRHYHGWPIEHRDAGARTISGHFGKTSRTIRNWLTKAEETLASRRGEQK